MAFKNRVEFTSELIALLTRMWSENENPILDYVKRSDEEQMHLFQEGRSKCDGITKISAHQKGMAADIYFISEDRKRTTEPKRGFAFWHKDWESLGGAKMIDWDKHHFE